jgi:hypothetical protein
LLDGTHQLQGAGPELRLQFVTLAKADAVLASASAPIRLRSGNHAAIDFVDAVRFG